MIILQKFASVSIVCGLLGSLSCKIIWWKIVRVFTRASRVDTTKKRNKKSNLSSRNNAEISHREKNVCGARIFRVQLYLPVTVKVLYCSYPARHVRSWKTEVRVWIAALVWTWWDAPPQQGCSYVRGLLFGSHRAALRNDFASGVISLLEITDQQQSNVRNSGIWCGVAKAVFSADEYGCRIPHPVCNLSTLKVKVLSTQDKHHISWAALQNYAAL